MKISDVIKWTSGRGTGTLPEECGVVSQDTRTLPLGALYVALRGERFDGHAFVAQAFAAGAAAALVEEDWQTPEALANAPLIRVENTHAALHSLAAEWRRSFPSPATRIVGLTGSSGKTTTREMTTAMLSGKGAKVYATKGNLNNDIGLPLSLLSMKPGASFGVFETGVNHKGEMQPLADMLRPDAAIVTNIGTAHIEFFGTQEGIAREKSVLLASLPQDGFAVIDADCNCFDILSSATKARVVTTSLSGKDADYNGELLDMMRGTIAVTERSGERTELSSGLPGKHNAADLILAFAAARELGIPADACAKSVQNLSLPGMRWKVEESGGVKIVNDAYNANPQSMEASVRTFMATVEKGRRILVLGDMFELGSHSEEEHRKIGALVAETKPDIALFIGVNMAKAADEASRLGFASGEWRESVRAAIPVLAESVREGDSILLKASRGMALENILAILAD